MTEIRVSIAIDAGIADVRLTRPDKMNALDQPMVQGIIDAIDRLADESGLRCVVLSGEGRAFCAGLDMASMAAGGSSNDLHARSHGLANWMQQLAWGWRMLPVPVIGAAHGIAFGGGLQILSGADVVFAAPSTRLSVMEIKWGIVPDMAGYALWRGRVHDDHLRELAYTAREFTADDGQRYGFVTHVADDPHAAAMALAAEIAGRNPHAVRAAKRLANLAADADAADILRAESAEQSRLMRTPNQLEAVMANMQKRAPTFVD
jgi:enoyl-CoA hydratase/carnithine racemase